MNIWVRSGKMMAGTADKPFTSKINIILDGVKDDQYLLVSNDVDAGNKVIAVSNGLELFGVVPQTTWTFLSAFASAGDK